MIRSSRRRIVFIRATGVSQRLPLQEFEKLYRKILRSEAPKKAHLGVELTLVRSTQMKRLIFQFRRKNRATDVLSFSSSLPHLLGSVVIDVSTAARQAKEFKHSTLREIQELFVHGIFHLLGYDHETDREARLMAQKENHFNRLWT